MQVVHRGSRAGARAAAAVLTVLLGLGAVGCGSSGGGSDGGSGGGSGGGIEPTAVDGGQDGDPGLSPVAPPPTDTGPTTVGHGATGSAPPPSPSSCGPEPTPGATCLPSPDVSDTGLAPQGG